MTITDSVKVVIVICWIPFAVLIGLLRRFAIGSDGKSLTVDLLLTAIRSASPLPLWLKRKAVAGGIKVQQTLQSPRFRQVKQNLCQHVERNDFSGYWITQGPLDGEASAPSKCDVVLLWIHGGAYVLGDPRMSLIQILRISEVLSSKNITSATFSLKYGLAPETTFPTPFEQGLAGYRYLLDEVHVAAEKIVICGESAGGHLALTILDSIQKNKLPKPGFALLQYPWVDLTNSTKSVVRNRYNDMLNAQDLNRAVSYACRDMPATMNHVFDYSGLRSRQYWSSVLPRKTWVGVGSHDLFVDSVHEFVQHAQEDGCDIQLDVWPLSPHAWPAIQDARTRNQYLNLQPGEDTGSFTRGAETIAEALLRMVE